MKNFRFVICLLLLLGSISSFSQQASGISYSWNSGSSLHISWTKGTYGQSLVVISGEDNGDLTNPGVVTALTGYNPNTNYAAAPETAAGSGDKIVYFDVGNSVDVTNIFKSYLGGDFVYTIKVYDTQYVNISGFSTQHPNAADGFQNPRNTQGLGPEPYVQPTVTVDSYTNTTVSFSWSPGSGTGRTAVVYTSPLVGSPADGNAYLASPSYGVSAVPGVGYVVSTDNTNSVTVTGLSPGGGYYLKVYEFYDVSGLARNYNPYTTTNITSQRTLADAPVAIAATPTPPQGIGFTANWNAAAGVDDYRLDVATDNTFGSGLLVNDATIAGGTVSYAVSGASSNTTYYYRIRSHNTAGTTASSNVISVLTAPAAPVIGTTTAIAQTGFTVNWNTVAGADGYFLDVSSVSDFSTFVSGYNNFALTPIFKAVTGLTAGTKYYFRVRAKNSANSISVYSATANIFTVPSSPNPTASSITQTSFTASWSASASATGYLLDVSTASNFGTYVSGYSALGVTGISQSVIGLTPGTTYYFRVRAVSSSGASPNPGSPPSLITIPPTSTASAASAFSATGFTANWSASTGASNYLLDVSTDNLFGSFIAGYNAFSLATTSKAITGLNGGTTYYYRVKSSNASGSSPLSNTISALTMPASPVPSAASNIGQTSFKANWAAANGASGYFLDVSTSSLFGSFVSGYSNLSVGSSTNSAVAGLSPNTTYYYRVRATNASGVSSNSGTITSLTLVNTPVASAATSPGQTGFTANWNTVTGASGYFIDVATDNGFVNVLLAYNNFGVGPTNLVLSGLSPGTNYFYRVRAGNASGSSPSSNSIQQITVPASPDPAGLSASGIGKNLFVANWDAVTGADSYDIDITKDNFVNLTASYNTNQLEQGVTGLTPSTLYQFRVSAKNTAGSSLPSVSKLIPTQDANGNESGLSLDHTTGNPSVKVNGGFGAITVTFHYRKITDVSGAFTSQDLTSTGTTYTATINPDMMDELGVEYYFAGTDIIGTLETEHDYSYRAIGETDSHTIPFAGTFDGTTRTYQMFSVPYDIADKNITSVFISMGAYDKTKWRLFHWEPGQGENGSYVENQDRLTKIETGKGYWFNTNQAATINPGVGQVVEANEDKDFLLSLEAGWNQIGNPFNFDVDWSVVQSANSSPIGTLSVFGSGGYSDATVFHPWAGGFLFSDQAGSLKIPITAKCASCRTGNPGSNFKHDPDEAQWNLPLTLSLNGENTISTIGMHPDAKTSKDQFDRISLPRFVSYLEMNTYHADFFAPYFSSDILPPDDLAEWNFSASSDQGSGLATLTWDQWALAQGESKLLLLDLDDQSAIDMKKTGSYRFNWGHGHRFRILYSKHDEIRPGITFLAGAYPNPFSANVTIPVVLETNQSSIQIRIYDVLGRSVRTMAKESPAAGVHDIEWDGRDDQGNALETGLYLYRLYGDRGPLSQARRIEKK